MHWWNPQVYDWGVFDDIFSLPSIYFVRVGIFTRRVRKSKMAVLHQYCWTFPGWLLLFCQQLLNITAQMRSLILNLSSGLVWVDHQGHNFVNDRLKVKSLSLNSQLCWWSFSDVTLNSGRERRKRWENIWFLTYLKLISYLIVFISVSISWISVIHIIFVQKIAQVLCTLFGTTRKTSVNECSRMDSRLIVYF